MNLRKLIVFENDAIVAVNKPSGLLSVPDRMGKEVSLKDLLIERYKEIFTVHRIDKDTSGLILFAKTAEAHKHFSLQFEQRNTEKIYYGLVHNTPYQQTGSITGAISEHPVKKGVMMIHKKGKAAHTDYQVEMSLGKYAWVRFQIHTGRTHQIRVHSKDIGHPIVCDNVYGDESPVLLSSVKSKFKLSKHEWEEKPLLNRLALHAYSLKLTDADGHNLHLTAPISKDLQVTVNQLEKWIK